MTRAQNLLHQLTTYTPADSVEAGHLSRMKALAESAGDSFSRDHFVPGHFTASAFILSPDSNSLLLIHHVKLDRWLQPGGHVEPEDTDLVAAASREITEEVGITPAPPLVQKGIFDLDIHFIPARKSDPAHEHFDVRFLFRARDLEVVVGDGVKACQWVPLAEINGELTDESVMRAIRKLAI